MSTSIEAPLARRLAAEALGTGLLVAVVIGSGIAAARLSPGDVGLQLLENALATAAGSPLRVARAARGEVGREAGRARDAVGQLCLTAEEHVFCDRVTGAPDPGSASPTSAPTPPPRSPALSSAPSWPT